MKILALLPSILVLLACSGSPHASGPVKHYSLRGKIVALDPQHQVATVDAAAIPNYMEAMTMEYPIASKEDFRALHVGEKISATMNVGSDEKYNLSDVKPLPSSK